MRRTRKNYRNWNLDENKENCDPNENAARKRGEVGCDPVQQNEFISSRCRYNLRTPQLKNLIQKPPNQIQSAKNTPLRSLDLNLNCDTCNVSTNDLNVFLDHNPIDLWRPCRFRCRVCGKLFSDSLKYLDDTIICTNKRKVLVQFKCSTCQDVYHDRNIFSIHESRHKKGNGFENPLIIECTDTNTTQVCENVKEQNKSDLIKPPFVCTICKEIIFYRRYAEAHLLVHNFSSCACSACELQMKIFQILT